MLRLVTDREARSTWLNAPVGSDLLALPSPSQSPPTPLEQWLGFRIDSVGEEQVAVTAPLDGSGNSQVVGVHNTPANLAEALRVGGQLTLLSEAVRTDLTQFRQAIEMAMAETDEPLHRRLLETAWGHFDRPGIKRRLVVTGPAQTTLESIPGAPNPLAQARPLRVDELQLLLQRRGAGRARFYDAQFRLDSWHHALWWLVPNDFDNSLRRLFQLPGDFIFHCELLDGPWMWTRMLFHGQAQDQEGLRNLESSLGTLARVGRIRGYNPFGSGLEEVFQTSLPGWPGGFPRVPHFSVPDWGPFLHEISVHSNATQSEIVQGDMPVGLSFAFSQPTVFFNWEDRATVAIEGPTGSGKTTLALLLGLMRTHRLVFVHMTRAENEAPGQLAQHMGGQYLNIDLPQTRNPTEFKAAADTLEKEIRQRIARWRNLWLKTGKAEGLPLVLRLKTGNPVLYTYYAYLFLQEVSDLLEDFFVQTGRRTVIIVDDLVGIPPEDHPDPHLGELAPHKGREFRNLLQLLMNTVRKRGANLILTVHSREEFKRFGAGFWGAIPLCIRLQAGAWHTRGEIWYPPDARIQSSSPDDPGFRGFFNPYLPAPIRERLGVP